jgi:sugar phosphate isomerase/epimerase
MGGVENALETLKQYILSTHVHDNHGTKDEHLFPGEGSIDWKRAMALLREAPHVPPLLLEIEGGERKDLIEKYLETFRTLETV